MFKLSPLYALAVVVLLFIAVLIFPVCVPSTMYNDGECDVDAADYYYERYDHDNKRILNSL